MKRLLSALSLAALLLTSSAGFAETLLHKPSGIQFWVPDDWKTEDAGGAQLTTTDPKQEVGLLFSVSDAKDTKAALAAIDKLIAEHATDVKAGAPKKTKLNGMDASVIDATGKMEGKDVELSVLIVKTPSKKFLVVLGMLETAKHKAHEANLVKILASIKPKK
jgi:predicted Zn-dependent protease